MKFPSRNYSVVCTGLVSDGMMYGRLAVPQAQVTEGLSSSVFEITALATIPSDNSTHKVINYIYM